MLIEKKVTSHSRLGFIGLGYLGSRIARRLANAGFPMVVHDRDRDKTQELVALGATTRFHWSISSFFFAEIAGHTLPRAMSSPSSSFRLRRWASAASLGVLDGRHYPNLGVYFLNFIDATTLAGPGNQSIQVTIFGWEAGTRIHQPG